MLYATCKCSPGLRNIGANVIQSCSVSNLRSTSKKTLMKQVQSMATPYGAVCSNFNDVLTLVFIGLAYNEISANNAIICIW